MPKGMPHQPKPDIANSIEKLRKISAVLFVLFIALCLGYLLTGIDAQVRGALIVFAIIALLNFSYLWITSYAEIKSMKMGGKAISFELVLTFTVSTSLLGLAVLYLIWVGASYLL